MYSPTMALELETLCSLIVGVKPSLASQELSANDRLRDLGLDSLDVLQLGRRIQRKAGVPFVIQDWVESRSEDAPITVGELLEAARASEG